MDQFRLFLRMLRGSFRDLLPIIAVIAFFQFLILKQLPANILDVAIGLSIVAVGLAIFLQGLEIGIFPVGEGLANDFANKGSVFWLLVFAFLIGFSTTIAEPALIAIAKKAASISDGRLDAFVLRLVVAVSVGSAIALGVFRILLGTPIHYFIIAGYVLVVGLTWFTPQEIVGLAYDSGGVTTSTVTVPLVAALGIGLASTIRGRDPVIDGFGLIAFASLTPMIFVQLYGIAVYSLEVTASPASAVAAPGAVDMAARFDLGRLVAGLVDVIKDVTPIVLVILFFQYVIIRKAIPHLQRVALGLLLVILGLHAFIVGLELGLFGLGASMALQLTQTGNAALIYLFGFLIGFSTTMAEPALIAVAVKAREVSNEKINDLL
ncbi:MAG: DUF1538 family protein, partial [Halieaceae bacterium]|nr:DUF1538 family protein [Halieaceae bacterium]